MNNQPKDDFDALTGMPASGDDYEAARARFFAALNSGPQEPYDSDKTADIKLRKRLGLRPAKPEDNK